MFAFFRQQGVSDKARFRRDAGSFKGVIQSPESNWFLHALGDSGIRSRNRITEYFSILVKPIYVTVVSQFTGLLQRRSVMVNRSPCVNRKSIHSQ